MSGYYNTNHEAGDTLLESRGRVSRQEDLVLTVFWLHPERNFAPHEIQEILADPRIAGRHYPLTSIRRAITNLTETGRLVKTEKMRWGTFGKKVHTWKLA